VSDKSEKIQVLRAQALLEMKENLPHFIEYCAVEAQMMRAKYLALCKQGFTEQQAIELCRRV